MLLAPTADGQLLNPHAEILEDPTGRLTIADVTAPNMRLRFAPLDGRTAFGFSNSTWWLRVDVRQQDTRSRDWLLEIPVPWLDRIDVYIPERGMQGVYRVLQAGDSFPFAERPVPQRGFLFPLTIEGEAPLTLHLRVFTRDSLALPVTAWSHTNHHIYQQRLDLIAGVYYGIILGLAAYNFFLFLQLRDPVLGWYVLSTLGLALVGAEVDGFAFQYLWPDSTWMADRQHVTLPPLSMALAMLFVRRFFARAPRIPGLGPATTGVTVLAASCMGIGVLADYGLANNMIMYVGLMALVVAFYAGAVSVWLGYAPGRYFLLATTCMLSGVATFLLRGLGVLPASILTGQAIQIGSAAEVLLWSFALAARVRGLETEREVALRAAVEAENAKATALRVAEESQQRHARASILRLTDVDERLRREEARRRRAEELLHASEARHRNMLLHDPLTGLPGRELLHDRLEQAVMQAARYGGRLAVVLFDVRGLRTFELEFGAGADGEVFTTVVRRLRAGLRESDTLARLDGHKLAVLLPEVDTAENARGVGRTLLESLRAPLPLEADGSGEVRPDASIGVAVWPDDGATAVEILSRADLDLLESVRASGAGSSETFTKNEVLP